MDLVSVIIPCYNHEKYIEKCLQSILDEKYENKEIVIIDDGSKDNSVEVIRNFIKFYDNDKHIIRLYTQENNGVVKTLNKLVDLANGKYIAVIASDDELKNDGIFKRVEYLEAHPDKMAVIGNAIVIDNDDKVLKENAAVDLFRAKKKLLNNKYLNLELTLQWSVVGPCLLLKKDVYRKIGKYNESYTVEDRDFYLRLIENNMLGYLDSIVAAYRVHGLNMSIGGGSNKVRIECAKINKAHAKFHANLLEKIFLSSYSLDRLFLEKKLIPCYWIHKIFRFTFISIYRNILSIFS